jgi:hypothetical protein
MMSEYVAIIKGKTIIGNSIDDLIKKLKAFRNSEEYLRG